MPIHITEFNPPSRDTKNKNPDQARLSDEEVAEWTVNFYTLAFSKPYIREITRWFLIDTIGGRGIDAGLVTLEGERKPSYYALRKLLKETWSTRWEGELKDGQADFRGFFGTYEARIGGETARFELCEGPSGPIEVRTGK
ncbi:MAG: hypothetical protein BWZ10_02733 [candidate division BRC1 bacterium ADurb.BinA364]|nr:MAG: hypothetical protein BWZ10_02733 [candidate division BRC1 bacterium ADurb.BinA364]